MMPLSEHEQRLLEQIERELYAEDPKFASTVRGRHFGKPGRRRRIQGFALLAVGIALLVLGLIIPFRVADIPLISVLGFPIMFIGAMLAITANRNQPASSDAGAAVKGKPVAKRNSFTERMEERFRRRFDER